MISVPKISRYLLTALLLCNLGLAEIANAKAVQMPNCTHHAAAEMPMDHQGMADAQHSCCDTSITPCDNASLCLQSHSGNHGAQPTAALIDNQALQWLNSEHSPPHYLINNYSDLFLETELRPPRA